MKVMKVHYEGKTEETEITVRMPLKREANFVRKTAFEIQNTDEKGHLSQVELLFQTVDKIASKTAEITNDQFESLPVDEAEKLTNPILKAAFGDANFIKRLVMLQDSEVQESPTS